MADQLKPTDAAPESDAIEAAAAKRQPNLRTSYKRLKDMGDGTFAEVVVLPAVNDGSSSAPLTVQGAVAIDSPIGTKPLTVAGRASTAVPPTVDADGDKQAAWVTRTGAAVVDGGVASDATDSGNPIKVGGIVSTTTPSASTTGKRKDAWVTQHGAQNVAIVDSAANVALVTTPVDGASNQSGLAVKAQPMIYGNGTWDRPRGVTTIKTKADASVTAATGVTLWTPAAGKKPRITKGQLSLSVAGQIILYDNAVGGTELIRSPQLAAGATWSFDLAQMAPPTIVASANSVIKADVTATGNLAGWIGGTEE